ncbi:hypothetical protein [Bartonella sp. AA16NXGY]
MTWEQGIDCFSHFTLISGGKGLLAMNRLMIGFNGAVYRKFVVFCEFAKS